MAYTLTGPEQRPRSDLTRGSLFLLVVLPAVKLAIHLGVAYGLGYEYHRDELYYLVGADRLDWGYVDHPPLSVFLLAITRALVGDSFPAIRIVPALAGAVTVLMVGLTARDLGGKAVAIALAMVAAIAAPFYLALDAFYSLNAFDLLVWALAGWISVRILRGGSLYLWVVLGVVLGLGLENKISVLWLSAGLFAGIVLSPQRRMLMTRGPWLAGAIAAAFFLPYVLWQVTHGWPTLEFMYNATSNKLVRQSYRSILGGQLDGMLSASAFIWVSGLFFFLWRPEGLRFRALGWAWLAIFIFLASNHTVRGAYFAPAYTWLLAGGGVAIELWLRRRGRRMRVAVPTALLVLITLQGLGASPFVLPILPQARLAARSLATEGGRRVEERTGIGLLPEFLGHMSGWRQLVDQIASVHARLPPGDKERAAILLPDYGLAAAVDVLGRPLGLPPALSGHNAYWMWGPGNASFEVAIIIGVEEPQLRKWFAEVTYAGTTHCTYCLPYESDRPIWIVRHPKVAVRDMWAQLKLFS